MDWEEDKAIGQAVAQVQELETKHRLLAQTLRSQVRSISSPGFLENELIVPVTALSIQGRVAAVDGGVLAREMHGLDIVLSRAVAAAFDYEGGRKTRVHYFPRARPPYTIKWRSLLESHEAAWFKGLTRLEAELTCAQQALESLAPDVLLLDGSIVPQPSDRPSKESPLAETYERITERYRSLYAACQSRGTLLLGVVKDSRGSRFNNLLVRSVPELNEHRHALANAHDSLFLSHLLKPGERTCFFKYASDLAQSLVLRDLNEWASKIGSVYLRPSKWDRPLRVDALLPPLENQYADFFAKVSGTVHTLAAINERYAMPAVLIEADLRARGEERDLDVACASLEAKLGMRPTLYPLRRDCRPFG